ncbi:MAG: R3H domain-containing nucleic acid-binding protein, partial [candidate division KSB1 bacterium]
MTEHHDDYTEAFEPEGSAPHAEEFQEQARPPRRDRDRDRPSGGRSGERRSFSDRGRGGYRPREEEEVDPRIAEMIRETEEKLAATYHPVQVENLNPFERKQFHRHFERRKSSYQTKTYRNEDNHVLWIFPVGNLKRFLEGKAQEAITSGVELALPPMSNYERFLAHYILKDLGTVESTSAG